MMIKREIMKTSRRIGIQVGGSLLEKKKIEKLKEQEAWRGTDCNGRIEEAIIIINTVVVDRFCSLISLHFNLLM